MKNLSSLAKWITITVIIGTATLIIVGICKAFKKRP